MRIARKLIAEKTAHATSKPGVPYTLGLAAACIRAQLAIEFPVAKKTAKVNGRDILFDAIVTGCGCDLTSMTRNFAKMVATAKRDILEATPDATPEEVQRRITAYKKKYSGAAITPMALANHWPEFGQPDDRKTRGFDYTQEPPNWQARLRRTGMPRWSKDSIGLLCEKAWIEVRANYGREIWEALGTS